MSKLIPLLALALVAVFSFWDAPFRIARAYRVGRVLSSMAYTLARGFPRSKR